MSGWRLFSPRWLFPHWYRKGVMFNKNQNARRSHFRRDLVNNVRTRASLELVWTSAWMVPWFTAKTSACRSWQRVSCPEVLPASLQKHKQSYHWFSRHQSSISCFLTIPRLKGRKEGQRFSVSHTPHRKRKGEGKARGLWLTSRLNFLFDQSHIKIHIPLKVNGHTLKSCLFYSLFLEFGKTTKKCVADVNRGKKNNTVGFILEPWRMGGGGGQSFKKTFGREKAVA